MHLLCIYYAFIMHLLGKKHIIIMELNNKIASLYNGTK